MNKQQRACRHCGKLFDRDIRNRKAYCSDKCHAEAKKEWNARYRANNREKVRAKARELYHRRVKKNEKEREKYRRNAESYRERNIDVVRERERDYYYRNKKKINARRKEWWKKRGRKIKEARKTGILPPPVKRGRPRIKS